MSLLEKLLLYQVLSDRTPHNVGIDDELVAAKVLANGAEVAGVASLVLSDLDARNVLRVADLLGELGGVGQEELLVRKESTRRWRCWLGDAYLDLAQSNHASSALDRSDGEDELGDRLGLREVEYSSRAIVVERGHEDAGAVAEGDGTACGGAGSISGRSTSNGNDATHQ